MVNSNRQLVSVFFPRHFRLPKNDLKEKHILDQQMPRYTCKKVDMIILVLLYISVGCRKLTVTISRVVKVMVAEVFWQGNSRPLDVPAKFYELRPWLCGRQQFACFCCPSYIKRHRQASESSDCGSLRSQTLLRLPHQCTLHGVCIIFWKHEYVFSFKNDYFLNT